MRRAIGAVMAFVLVGGVSETDVSVYPMQRGSNQATLQGAVRCSGGRPGVVYLTSEAPSVRVRSDGQAVIDQRGLTFLPHVLPVTVGTRVSFLNSDPVSHNVFSPSAAKPFNLGSYPSGEARHVTFDRPGVVEILCNVHLEMNAYIVVLSTPYFTLITDDGRYRLTGLPRGPATLSVWCPARDLQQQKVVVQPGSNEVDVDLLPGA